MDWGDNITHLVSLLPGYMSDVKMRDPVLKGLSSVVVNKIIVGFLSHSVKNPPPELVKAIHSVRQPVEFIARVLAKGWDHSSFPFEVVAIEGSPRWADVQDHSRKDKAIEAHRAECGCLWPEMDYIHPINMWLSFIFIGKLYDPGVIELLSKMCERPGFVNNIEAAIKVVEIIIAQHPSEESESIFRIEALLREAAELKHQGKLNHYAFSDPASWSFCDGCGAGIPPEAGTRNSCIKCIEQGAVA